MGTFDRKRTYRVWSVSLGALWLLAFIVAPLASADSANFKPAGSGEGWYWTNRPTTDAPGDDPVGDAFNYPIPGQGPGSGKVFAPDHLYVAWDGVQTKTEMFAGVSFDLSAIPQGSEITSFRMSLVWHPAGASHQNTPNYEAIKTQGIMACYWPEFIAGAPAVAASSAPPNRDCANKKVDGTVTMPTEPIVSATVVSWSFDLTPIASKWAGGDNPSISIEPKGIATQGQSWQTSFHASTYTENDGTGTPVPKPGVLASVTWTPPADEDLGGGDDSFTTDVGGDISSFGDSGGLAEQLAPPLDVGTGDEGDAAVLSSGAIEGVSADFWDIPLLAKVVAILGFFLIAGSGWIVQSDSGRERPPGAASALMRGAASDK